jgi:PRC-barrel domain
MSGRILMATVAALALAMPVAAQDQPKPLDSEQQPDQQLEATQPAPPGQGATGGATGEAAQPPAMAGDQPAGEAPAEVAAEEEATPPAEMKFLEVQEEAQFLADDEVIGKSVVNVGDEEVGRIADLVMDQEQKLVGVVLSVGGFLGIGDKWVAVPVDQIDFPADEQPARLLVAVTEEQLKNAPDFMTREAVEAEAAAQAQQQAAQQQQIPPPTTANQ